MDSIVQAFHLDWHLLIAQLVNFGIVVVVLGFFVIKPLSNKLNERSRIINKSLDEAKAIAEKMQAAEEKNKEIIKNARTQAQQIVNQAKEQAEIVGQKTVALAKEQTKEILAKGERQLTQAKEQMISEAKSELMGLVVMASSKVLSAKVDKKTDRELINKVLKGTEIKK
jgi:F-type H+-transporting ATPase subunit b